MAILGMRVILWILQVLFMIREDDDDEWYL